MYKNKQKNKQGLSPQECEADSEVMYLVINDGHMMSTGIVKEFLKDIIRLKRDDSLQ